MIKVEITLLYSWKKILCFLVGTIYFTSTSLQPIVFLGTVTKSQKSRTDCVFRNSLASIIQYIYELKFLLYQTTVHAYTKKSSPPYISKLSFIMWHLFPAHVSVRFFFLTQLTILCKLSRQVMMVGIRITSRIRTDHGRRIDVSIHHLDETFTFHLS